MNSSGESLPSRKGFVSPIALPLVTYAELGSHHITYYEPQCECRAVF